MFFHVSLVGAHATTATAIRYNVLLVKTVIWNISTLLSCVCVLPCKFTLKTWLYVDRHHIYPNIIMIMSVAEAVWSCWTLENWLTEEQKPFLLPRWVTYCDFSLHMQLVSTPWWFDYRRWWHTCQRSNWENHHLITQ